MPTLLGAIDPNLSWYLALAALSTALLIGVPMALRVIREAKGDVEPESETGDDLLAPITQAFAAGQMSQEEYVRIKASILAGEGGVPPVSKAKLVKPESIPELPGLREEETGTGTD